MQSPFLNPDATTRDNQLAILHIRRDQSIPTILAGKPNPDLDTGYAEGVVTNTRFGSFPHSTLVGLPWGSQVRASLVDTGSRGRRPLRPPPPAGQKRKADEAIDDDDDDEEGDDRDRDRVGEQARVQQPTNSPQKEAVAADSGFIHVLPPTPENWTTSLPHRTQVVYTPDYSYILHRIRARPGSVLIEAGSGSGSFTHAAARAVFNGYPGAESGQQIPESNGEELEAGFSPRKKRKFGRVFSYEFHADRYRKVKEEMKQHGLSSIVTVTERDVYGQGFLLNDDDNTTTNTSGPKSPRANAIFLDLPSPWLALPHLTRQSQSESESQIQSPNPPSPLDPTTATHICSFSPCIEQAQRTISALRRHGWLDIEMVEMAQKRLDVRREHTGLQYEGMRGVNAIAADVEQALARLKEVEMRSREYRSGQGRGPGKGAGKGRKDEKTKEKEKLLLFREGVLVHRPEPEIKTHTSYLVFAVLPLQWAEAEEMAARRKWSDVVEREREVGRGTGTKSVRQIKREAKAKAKLKAKVEVEAGAGEGEGEGEGDQGDTVEGATVEPEDGPRDEAVAEGEGDTAMNVES